MHSFILLKVRAVKKRGHNHAYLQTTASFLITQMTGVLL